jgi:hypothetical protein
MIKNTLNTVEKINFDIPKNSKHIICFDPQVVSQRVLGINILDGVEHINYDIKKIIDEQNDVQNHETNVKAQMTEWKVYHPSFMFIANKAVELIIEMQEKKYNTTDYEEFIVMDLWGMKYVSENHALRHHHYPANWAFSYYIDPPKNSPGLFLYSLNKEIEIKDSMLIVFEATEPHEVIKREFEGERYVVAGNIKVVMH